MGFIRQVASKITGADVQADVTQRAADQQAEATRSAAEQAAKATQEASAQAARMQESAAARATATSAASDLLNKPMENVDVRATPKTNESAIAASRKRRQSFGIGAGSTGVNI